MAAANPLVDPAARLVIGHRGASARAPENTLESFALALADGADALELDVQLTAEGEVVVLHDQTVDRTTDGHGAVELLPLARVRTLDAGARYTPDGGRTHPFRAHGVRIPTMSEVLDAFRGVPLLIDVKTRRVASALRRVLERHRATARVVVASFEARNLEPLAGSALATGATRRDVLRLVARLWLGMPPRRLRYDALSIPPAGRGIRLPIARIVGAVHRLGRPVHVWTIDDPAAARVLWHQGVNGIISDDPRVMRGVLDGLTAAATLP